MKVTLLGVKEQDLGEERRAKWYYTAESSETLRECEEESFTCHKNEQGKDAEHWMRAGEGFACVICESTKLKAGQQATAVKTEPECCVVKIAAKPCNRAV